MIDENKYMSRKFGLAVFAFLSALPLILFNYITGAEYVTLNSIILGLYFTGNVASDYVNKKT